MKPTSIIFLIVTVMLACGGILLCISAENLATEQGVALFRQEQDGNNNYIESYNDIDTETLRKLTVSLKDADINVIGGAETSRIELVNFGDNSYNITMGTTQLTISSIDGISGLIDLDSFKINFDGFRNYPNYLKFRNKEKTVNIYLSDNAPLIFLELKTELGNIAISDIGIDCDYRLSCGEGSISLAGITTGSTISIDSAKKLESEIKNVTARELIFSAEGSANATIDSCTFEHKIDAEIKNGSFTYYRAEGNFAGFNVELYAPNGKLLVFGKEYTAKYSELNVETALTPIDPTTTVPADTAADTAAADTTDGGTDAPAPDDELNAVIITVKNGDLTIAAATSAS